MTSEAPTGITTRRKAPARAVSSRWWAGGFPWLWHDQVAARTTLPLWVLAFLLFVPLQVCGMVLAGLAGHLNQFLADPRWSILTVAPALGAIAMAYIPRALTRFWSDLRPWLTNPEEEVLAAQDATVLMRAFWPVFLLVTFSMAVFSFADAREGWFIDYVPLSTLRYFPVSTAIFVGYFVGGAIAMATFGLALFARRLRRLDLKDGFILHGGKAALKPFNQLLWTVWGAFTLPTILILALPAVLDQHFTAIGVTAGILISVMLFSTLIVPQLFMNQWLAKEKAQEVRHLRSQLDEAATPPPQGSSPEEILRRMHRHQHLLHLLQEARAFTPTLLDARFIIQVSTSVTAIIAANILIRTLLR